MFVRIQLNYFFTLIGNDETKLTKKNISGENVQMQAHVVFK